MSVDAKISAINLRLNNISQEAQRQGAQPIDPNQLPPSADQEELRPTLTPSGFWNHYIGGCITAVNDYPPHWASEMRPVTDSSQRKVYELATRWALHPIGSVDPLNRETTQAFLTASIATRWSENQEYLHRLAELVFKVGDLYANREGIRLIR